MTSVLAGAAAASAWIAAMATYEGVVLWLVWGWFVVPLGVPPITVPWAVGIAMIAGLLGNTPHIPDNARGEHLALVLVKPALVLAVAWVAKQFM